MRFLACCFEVSEDAATGRRRAQVMAPDHIAAWVAAWGYLGIFVFVFIGNLGIPVPEETVLLAAGFLTAQDHLLDLKTVLLVAIVSAVIGDNCGYLVGRTGGQRLLERLSGTFEIAHQRYERFKVFFRAHGNKTVFLARFIAGLRFMAGPMAGAAGMPFMRFFGWNVLGAIIWCTCMVAVGHVIGDQWDEVARAMHSAGRWLALGVALIAIAGYLIWWRERQTPATRPHL